VVFVKWAIQDITFSRGARLITGEAPSDFNFNNQIASENRTTGTEAKEKSTPAVA